MLLLIASSLGLERSGDSLHRLLQYPQADEEALPSSVPPPQGEGVGLEREGNSEDRFVIKTTNLFQPSTPGAQNHRKTGQNQPRKHSGNRNAAADREQNSVGGALAPHSHDRSQPPGKAVQYATKYLRRRGDARVDEAKREGIVRHDEGVHHRSQRAAPGAHSGSQKHHNPHSNEPSGLSNVKHAHGPTSSTGRATHGPSHPHGPAKSKRHRRFSDAEFFEKRLPEQRDRMEPPSDDVADALAQNSAVGVSSAEANAEASAATKEADEKAAAEAKERAVPGWADNIEAAGETKESKVPLGTMQHPWDGNGWAQEAQEEGSQEGQAATASTELSEKRLPPQPPMDGEVADSVDTALPGSARAAAENTEENSDPNADAKSAGEWEMPGETKESSVPLGTMQNPTTEEAAASEMAATEAMAAGEKTEEKAEAEAGAENEAGWEMAGETKESEVPLGTMQNPAADVTEGESRVADAIAQNSAVGVSSAEANAESSAATKEADKKAEKEAKERAVPGWADNIEAAGETKESKVPLGTMQQPWDGNGWQESPSR